MQWGSVFTGSSSVTKWQNISLDNGENDSSGVAIESSTAMRPQMVRVQSPGSFDPGARTDMKLHQGCAIVTGTIPFILDSSSAHCASSKYCSVDSVQFEHCCLASSRIVLHCMAFQTDVRYPPSIVCLLMMQVDWEA